MSLQRIIILFGSVMFITFFSSNVTLQAQYKAGHIIINEVLPNPTGSDSASFPDGEWIEIYNPTDQDVDVSGWAIQDTEGTVRVYDLSVLGVIQKDEYVVITRADSNIVLNNSGDRLILIDDMGNLVDESEYDSSPEGKSFARMHNGVFEWAGQITPGAPNFLENMPEAEFTVDDVEFFVNENIIFDASNSSSNLDGDEILIFKWDFGDGFSGSVFDDPAISHKYLDEGVYEVGLVVENSMKIESDQYRVLITILEAADVLQGVVINEFVADPISGDQEWIEMYNFSDDDINIENWELHDGAANSLITTLNGVIQSKGFYVWNLTSGKLNNSGDNISLLNRDGVLIDSVSYGNWDDGQINDNASAVSDPNSAARVRDGYDTNIDVDDFRPSSTTTKGSENIISWYEEDEVSYSYQYSDFIIINEVLPNPEGSDENEWIELYNAGLTDISLNGWQIDDFTQKGSKPFLFSDSHVIKMAGYLIVNKNESGISLNNTDEQLNLIDPDGRTISQVDYQKSYENQSFAYTKKGDYVWTTTITKGSENIITVDDQGGKSQAVNSLSTKMSLSPVERSNLSKDQETIEKINLLPNLSDQKKRNSTLPLITFWKNTSKLLKILIFSEILVSLLLLWFLSKFVYRKIREY